MLNIPPFYVVNANSLAEIGLNINFGYPRQNFARDLTVDRWFVGSGDSDGIGSDGEVQVTIHRLLSDDSEVVGPITGLTITVLSAVQYAFSTYPLINVASAVDLLGDEVITYPNDGEFTLSFPSAPILEGVIFTRVRLNGTSPSGPIRTEFNLAGFLTEPVFIFLTNQTDSRTEAGPLILGQVNFDSTGTLDYTLGGATLVNIPGQWLLSGVASDYEIRLTELNGYVFAGLTPDVWTSMATDVTPQFALPSYGTQEFELLFEIRLISSGSIQATANYSLTLSTPVLPPGTYGFGSNLEGYLGIGSIATTYHPTILPAVTWDSIAMAVPGVNFSISAGLLYAWGRNDEGQLGLGDVADRDVPTQVGAATNWASVYTNGYSTFGIRADGTLWAWGRNDYGQLGINSLVFQGTPIQVGTDTDWDSVAISSLSSVALKTTGTLWSTGRNNVGQLGLNDLVDRDEFTQIGVATTWTSVTTDLISDFFLALNGTGTLWSWGSNSEGQLGLGDLLDRDEPAQVGVFTDWVEVKAYKDSSFSRCFGLRGSGNLYSWGSNAGAVLGLNDFTDRDEPTQIGILTDWTSFGAVNQGNSIFALRTGGLMYAWGLNGNGQLGLGDSVDRDEPVQVALTGWTQVPYGSGTERAYALRGQAMYTAGINYDGELGLGNHVSVPTVVNTFRQIANNTPWDALFCGPFYNFAVAVAP